ncbi:MAG TPA: hypothetical protein PKK61_06395 [Defluviitaleaceae bacterium]|jgi:site-specific recombinase XerD|nr:hypothetical protein [Candidatus Epulonipiscium sp.]HOA80674.1 hypothetical protein [Defluviitaleaceae bacterium]
MDLEMVNKEVADVFSTYETSMENRIRYISGMEHFIQYLYHQNIELENVGEAEIKQYEESLKALGYPDVFIDTNIESIRKYFSYLQNKNYINNYNGFIE